MRLAAKKVPAFYKTGALEASRTLIRQLLQAPSKSTGRCNASRVDAIGHPESEFAAPTPHLAQSFKTPPAPSTIDITIENEW
jgi:hypothetical protein